MIQSDSSNEKTISETPMSRHPDCPLLMIHYDKGQLLIIHYDNQRDPKERVSHGYRYGRLLHIRRLTRSDKRTSNLDRLEAKLDSIR
jgi:hypothetical protein